jgi:hypothetical protein
LQIKNIDEILKASASFLDQHDETYVNSKLLEMAQKNNENNIYSTPTNSNTNNTANNNSLTNATSFTTNTNNNTTYNPSQSAANFFHPPFQMVRLGFNFLICLYLFTLGYPSRLTTTFYLVSPPLALKNSKAPNTSVT